MGWGYGIVNGREVGYGVEAVCDLDGCDEVIDRGLGYLCGTMHGDDDGCMNYFCGVHLYDHGCPNPFDLREDED